MSHIRVVVLTSCLLIVVASGVAAADWTSWRGPHQSGASDEVGLIASWSKHGENLIWRADFVGRSTPVVFNGRVCAFGRQGTEHDRGERVACWSAADGELLWQRSLVVHNSTIPFNRAAWASPTADAETDYLYIQGSDGHLSCFDGDGRIVWRRALHEEQGRFSGYGGRTANPILFEDMVIANVINSSVLGFGRPSHRYYAFDKRSGEILWTSSPGKGEYDKNAYSNPVIATVDGREQMIGGAADGWIYALEPRTGRKIWSFQLSKRGINSSVVVAGDTVYASHSQENIDAGTMGRLVAIDATGSGDVTESGLRWKIDGISAGYASPAHQDGVLYVVDDSANLHGIDAESGEPLWEPVNIGTIGKGSPVWADGRLYATEVNGRLSILRADRDGAQVIDRDELTMADGRAAELYGSVAISGGRIYFTTEEGIYCLGEASRPFEGGADLADAATIPEGSGEAAVVQLVPAEVLIAPGQEIRFRARAFDARGRPLGAVTPTAMAVDGLAGEVEVGDMSFTAGDAPFQVGHVTLRVGELSAKARVRVLSPLPWSEDFSSRPVGKPLPHWVFAGRFRVEKLDGEPVLNKFPVRAGLQRTRTYIGPASLGDYTIEADVMSRSESRTRADMGLVNSGYTLELLGTHQKVQVSSWHSVLRMAETVDYPWQPDTWYRMRLRVEPAGEHRAIVRGKVWRRDEAEPSSWTIEVEDDFGVTEGAPGIYGYSPVDVYYDNVALSANSALPRQAAASDHEHRATPHASAPAKLPTTKREARERVEGPEPPAAMFGGTLSRNMVSAETGLPDDWDIETGKNILWQAKLGSQSYGGPVVFRDKIYVGTNNESPRDPEQLGDRGVVMAFHKDTGEFLWQIVHSKLPRGRVNDWPLQGVCSTPFVQGDRLWYISNEAEIICADTADGDIIWKYNMMTEVDAFPHNLAVSSPLAKGGMLFAITGNGVDEGHVNIPNPGAPSFIALEQQTGALLWEDASPGNDVLHGSWSNAAYGDVDGSPQVIFPGGDGWIYSFVPETGELLWKFDCNPKDSTWELGGAGTRNNLISTPVLYDGKVYIAVGQDPEHGEGVGHLYALDASKRGDITETGVLWQRGGEDYHRTISTVAIADGLLYAADMSGFLYCLDLETGEPYWTYDAFAAVWSSPFVADGKVYLTDEDGDVAILKHGKEKELIREINMDNAIYTTPVALDGVLYISTRSRLFAIATE